MYSSTIKPRVDVIFNDLRKKISAIIIESSTANGVINDVTKLVSSELATRSKSILSDMLFELSDKLMDTEFFSDIAKQNRFMEINLRQEILNKYQFTPSTTINYKEISKFIQALKVGGKIFVVGGVAEIGAVLIAGLSISNLVPLPFSALIVASVGFVLVDYYTIEPARNKKAFEQALDSYLIDVKQQLLNWFDEVEKYFNMRVEEIKRIM